VYSGPRAPPTYLSRHSEARARAPPLQSAADAHDPHADAVAAAPSAVAPLSRPSGPLEYAPCSAHKHSDRINQSV
jgi:hypothetical protein